MSDEVAEHGTFVYQVSNGAGLQLRSRPDYAVKYKEGEVFATGSILSSGMRVRGKHGDWFPLIGKDKWLFETRDGERTLERLAIQEGSFLYRVNNPNVGLALRAHPDYDSKRKVQPEVIFPHGAVISGTHRVKGEKGDYFVQLEGGGWLFETREGKETLIPTEEDRSISVYRVTHEVGLAVRLMPDYNVNYRVGQVFELGDVVASGLRVRGEHGDWFPRIGNEGWLFETREGQQTLERVDIQEGSFLYRVNNPNVGLALRAHPDYDSKRKVQPEVVFPHGAMVAGVRRVRGEFGDWFVQLEGGGWLFETRQGIQTLIPQASFGDGRDSGASMGDGERPQKRQRTANGSLSTLDARDAVIVNYLEAQLREIRKKHSTDTLPAHVPNEFVCPITHEVMCTPVVAADGFSYERAALEQWLENHDTSPRTGAKLSHKNLVDNRTLQTLIFDSCIQLQK